MPVSLPAIDHHLTGAPRELELLEDRLEESRLVGIAPTGVPQPAQTVARVAREIARDLDHGLVAVTRREPAPRHIDARRLACRERVDFMSIVGLDAPDFRTVSDFRKRHLKALGGLFGELVVEKV